MLNLIYLFAMSCCLIVNLYSMKSDSSIASYKNSTVWRTVANFCAAAAMPYDQMPQAPKDQLSQCKPCSWLKRWELSRKFNQAGYSHSTRREILDKLIDSKSGDILLIRDLMCSTERSKDYLLSRIIQANNIEAAKLFALLNSSWKIELSWYHLAQLKCKEDMAKFLWDSGILDRAAFCRHDNSYPNMPEYLWVNYIEERTKQQERREEAENQNRETLERRLAERTEEFTKRFGGK